MRFSVPQPYVFILSQIDFFICDGKWEHKGIIQDKFGILMDKKGLKERKMNYKEFLKPFYNRTKAKAGLRGVDGNSIE